MGPSVHSRHSGQRNDCHREALSGAWRPPNRTHNLELARVDASRARLDSVELLPFREAIKAGVGGVMTFHGYLPALDNGAHGSGR
jgi:beta-glucosidase-like glycosyl hydrolase